MKSQPLEMKTNPEKQQPTGASIARNALSMCVCVCVYAYVTEKTKACIRRTCKRKTVNEKAHTMRDGQAQPNRVEWRQKAKEITKRTRVNTKFLTRVFSKLLPGSIAAAAAAATPWRPYVCAWWHKAVVIAVRISHVSLQHSKRLLITGAHSQTHTQHKRNQQTTWKIGWKDSKQMHFGVVKQKWEQWRQSKHEGNARHSFVLVTLLLSTLRLYDLLNGFCFDSSSPHANTHALLFSVSISFKLYPFHLYSRQKKRKKPSAS